MMQGMLFLLRRLFERVGQGLFLNTFKWAVREAVVEPLAQAQQHALLRDPLDLFVLQHFLFNTTGHYGRSYEEWRMRRISKIMSICGMEPFTGKRVLEIGGGLGDIGAFFASLGANVVSAEFRAENRLVANLRYRNIPTFNSVFCDADDDFSTLGRFDLILCMGFLEVVNNVDHVMAGMMQLSDRIILETMVVDSTDPAALVKVPMPRNVNDHPPRGVSLRPSPGYIESFFTDRGWNATRYFTPDLNTSSHVYDWPHKNDQRIEDHGRVLRRFWEFTGPSQ